MFKASGDFIPARGAKSRRQAIEFLEVARKGHQAIRRPAMPNPQKMPGFVKANFGGSQVHSRRIFVPEPVKRYYGCPTAKLRFAEHELENRSAQVAWNDPELEFCSISDRFERLEDFSCSILAAEGKVGILGIRQRRQDRGVEAHQGLQVCRNDRNRQGIHTPERDNIQMAFFGRLGKIAHQLPLSLIEWEPPDNTCGSLREKRLRPSQRAKFESGAVELIPLHFPH